jgi:Outer membrane protein beta-barrel domain
MLHLDDNLDELFKKAGENYSLKDNDSAWESILEKTKEASLDPLATNKKLRFSGYNLAVLLIIVFTNLFVAMPIKLNDSKYNFAVKVESKNNDIELVGNKTNEKTLLILENNNNNNQKHPFLKRFNNVSNNTFTSIKNSLSIKNNNKSSVFNTPIPNDATNLKSKFLTLENKQKTIVSNDNDSSINNETISLKEVTIFDVEEPIELFKSTNKTEAILAKKDEKLSKASTKKGFYVGIAFGPQINQVNAQPINKIGVDIGATIGYNFTKKLSVETGLFYSKKQYYSKGEYFSMAKVASSMPANMELLSLNGTTNILEIPLSIKYKFLNKLNASYYASLGVSTYLLANESNDYVAMINGTKQNMQGNYNNNETYFNATINFSVGYEHKIFKKATLKIEPYIQIPTRQMGVGLLPVSSAGIHFGISLPLY